MNTIAKIARETDWKMVSVVGGAALSAVLFLASLKSDIRDLSTQLSTYHANQAATDAKVDRLYDMFVGDAIGTSFHAR